MMVVGRPPFDEAKSDDPYYWQIVHGNFDLFW